MLQGPPPPDPYIEANKQYKQENWERAEKLYAKVPAGHDHYDDARARRGASLAHLGELDEATALWRAVYEEQGFTTHSLDEAGPAYTNQVLDQTIETSADVKSVTDAGDYLLATTRDARGGTLVAYDKSSHDLEWERTIGKSGSTDIGPDVHEETAYVVIREGEKENNLMAIDVSDGSEKWTAELGYTNTDTNAVYSDGRILSATMEGAEEALVAYDAESGERLWRTEIDDDPGHVYDVGDHACTIMRKEAVVCVSQKDGGQMWNYSPPDRIHRLAGHGTRLYFSTSNALYSVEIGEDPAMVWKETVDGGLSTPALSEDGSELFVQEDGLLHAFEAEEGEKLWTSRPPAGESSSMRQPDVAGDRIVAHTGEGIYLVDAEDGDLLWYADIDYQPGSNVVSDGDTIYIGGSSRKTLLALEPVAWGEASGGAEVAADSD